MRRALIGYTGFVGSNLDLPNRFTDRYNSKNIDSMQGEAFDEVWCAGVQAVKWWANQNPTEDLARIERLLAVLATVSASRFVLISTVDVYADPVGVDEDTPVAEEGNHPYGAHRLEVERFVSDSFGRHHILRLPGLYGAGLKKNLLFDALNGRPLDGFHRSSAFQFYGLDRLWRDAAKALEAGLHVMNVAVEPVTVAAVVHRLRGEAFTNETSSPAFRYDMQTKHAALWGKRTPYLQTSSEVLNGIAEFRDKVQGGL